MEQPKAASDESEYASYFCSSDDNGRLWSVSEGQLNSVGQREHHTRVVCMSDTHNQHHELRLPLGDVLVHAGDILTESGTRYVSTGIGFDRGVGLFDNFCTWLGEQPHAFKVVVPGNHDMVREKREERGEERGRHTEQD